jgi:hypothetical protein
VVLVRFNAVNVGIALIPIGDVTGSAYDVGIIPTMILLPVFTVMIFEEPPFAPFE